MKRITFTFIFVLSLIFVINAGEFYLFSNGNGDRILNLTEAPLSSKVNISLNPGEVAELIKREDGCYLMVNLEGEAGWLDISSKEFNTFFKKVEDKALDNYYDQDNVDYTESTRFSYSEFKDSPLKITVSLKGLTVHVQCEEEDFDKVFPVGVGVKDSKGKSITPTNKSQNKPYFLTLPDNSNGWYYMKRRTKPEYFGGFPFIRLTAENDKRQNTYGLHGPITKNNAGKWFLKRGYVSHGCMRMRGEDVTEIYNLAYKYPGARVYIIEDYEYTSDKGKVDVKYPRW